MRDIFRVLHVVAVSALFLNLQPLQAQSTWTGGGANNNWSTPLNWNTPPSSSASTSIILAGTTRTATIQDIANPFILNQLTMNSTATAGFSISGNPLQFAGTGAQIRTDVAGQILQINSAIDFSVATTIDVTANTTGVAELTMTGRLTGAGNITKTASAGSGTEWLIQSSNNTLTGTITNANGSIYLQGANALGRQASLNSGTASTQSTTFMGVAAQSGQGIPASVGVSQQLGSVSGAGGLQIGFGTSPATLLTGFNNASTTFGGQIFLGNVDSQLAKVGTGTMTFDRPTSGSSIFTGSLSVRDGTFTLQELAGSLASPNLSVGGTAIYGGATLRLNNGPINIADRLQNNGAIQFGGGRLLTDGNSGTNMDEQVGILRVGAGQSTIDINSNTDRTHRLAFTTPNGGTEPSATVLGAGGTVLFRGTNLGSTPFGGTPPAGGASLITFENNPALVGGSGSQGTFTVSILPWGLGASGGVGANPDTFVTINGNGVRPLSISGEYNTDFTGGTTQDNVRLTVSTSVNAATTKNSILLDGQTVFMNANLQLTSGGMINSVGTSTLQGTGTVQFGPSGGSTAYITATSPINLQAPAQAANLAKSGGSTLTVDRPFSLGANGLVAVNAGTLAINNNGSSTTGGFSASSGTLTYQVSRGATLNVSGVTSGFTVGTSTVLRGNGTISGNTTIGNGGTVAPSALGGPNISTPTANDFLASPGTLNVGNMTWSPGGSYRWFVSSAIDGDYTRSQISGTGSLDLSGLSSANRFAIRIHSLAPTNATGSVYDFDNTQSYSWVIATFTGGINEFAANKFNLDSSTFSNNLGAGMFEINQIGNNLVLNFTPVPEPGTMLALAVAGLGAGQWIRRRVRRTTQVA